MLDLFLKSNLKEEWYGNENIIISNLGRVYINKKLDSRYQIYKDSIKLQFNNNLSYNYTIENHFLSKGYKINFKEIIYTEKKVVEHYPENWKYYSKIIYEYSLFLINNSYTNFNETLKYFLRGKDYKLSLINTHSLLKPCFVRYIKARKCSNNFETFSKRISQERNENILILYDVPIILDQNSNLMLLSNLRIPLEESLNINKKWGTYYCISLGKVQKIDKVRIIFSFKKGFLVRKIDLVIKAICYEKI